MKEKKKMNLGVKILLGMVLGIVVGAILWLALGVDKANEIATAYIKPFGDIFVNLLKYIVVPLVLLSIMDGVISMGDIGKVGKIGWKTVVYFLCTTAIACVIGLVVANIFKGSFRVLEMAEDAAYEAKNANIMDTVKGIFPSNFIDPLLNSAMLQIIVISLFFGCGILVAGEKGKVAADVVSSFNEVTQKVMTFILAVSPIGVFCLMTWVVSNQGPKILGDLGLVLPNHIFVKLFFDFLRLWQHGGGLAVTALAGVQAVFILQNGHTQLDTLIADIDAGSGDQPARLALRLPTKGTANASLFDVIVIGHSYHQPISFKKGFVYMARGQRCSMTLSIKPYSIACSAVMKLSRSVSRSMTSSGWPVRSAKIRFKRFLVCRMWFV